MIGFGQYGKERKKVIDKDCLVTIDPSAEGFLISYLISRLIIN